MSYVRATCPECAEEITDSQAAGGNVARASCCYIKYHKNCIRELSRSSYVVRNRPVPPCTKCGRRIEEWPGRKVVALTGHVCHTNQCGQPIDPMDYCSYPNDCEAKGHYFHTVCLGKHAKGSRVQPPLCPWPGCNKPMKEWEWPETDASKSTWEDVYTHAFHYSPHDSALVTKEVAETRKYWAKDSGSDQSYNANDYDSDEYLYLT